MNIFKLLKKNKLFYNFEDKEINKIFDCLNGHINKYSRGRVVAEIGAPVTEIGIILTGAAVKFIQKPNGELENCGELYAGDMFGEVEGYTGDHTYNSSVVVAEESTILYISVDTIVKQCSNTCACHQKLLENVLSCLAERIDNINNDAKYLKIKSMRGKISKLFYDRYLAQGTETIHLGFNRNEMAEYLNVSRPSMSREMIAMREDGIISFRKDEIVIHNVDELARLANSAR
ncbi:MAG: Crp/Fnr family transcriptional regulator [Clostridia bacterium]|nr:Crp/Fnr family transcriptional regulator [Clostridia bacterium]